MYRNIIFYFVSYIIKKPTEYSNLQVYENFWTKLIKTVIIFKFGESSLLDVEISEENNIMSENLLSQNNDKILNLFLRQV